MSDVQTVNLDELKEKISFDKRVYGIKDVKTGKFAPPFISESDAEAKRIFGDLVVASNESMLAKHPEDFDLYYLGVFDSVTGCHTGSGATYLLRAQDVVDEYRRKYSSQLIDNSLPKEDVPQS